MKKWFVGILLLFLGIGTNVGFVNAETNVGDTLKDAIALSFQPSAQDKDASEIDATSTLTDQKDVDYYSFTLNSNGLINFYIQQSPSAEIGVALYSQSGKELENYYMVKGNDKVILFQEGLPKGKYYFKVFAESGTVQNLSYNVQGMFYEGDGVELEPNNDVKTANPIKLGEEYVGFTDAEKDSKDVFRFTTAKNGVITVNGSHANVGVKYELMNAKQEVIESWELDPGNSDKLIVISKTGLAAGMYYLAVTKTSGNTDNEYYHFEVDFKEINNYEKELNDTMKLANPINLNATYSGILGSKDDKEFYRFTVAKNKKTSIFISNVPDTTFKVNVLSSNGKVVKAFITKKGKGNLVKLADLDLKKGTYYLDIEFQQGEDQQIPYSFAVK